MSNSTSNSVSRMCTEALQLYEKKKSDWIGTLLVQNVTVITEGDKNESTDSSTSTGSTIDICQYLPGSPNFRPEVTHLRFDSSIFPPSKTDEAPFGKSNPTYIQLRQTLQLAAIECGYSLVPRSGARFACKCGRTYANAKSNSTKSQRTAGEVIATSREEMPDNDPQQPFGNFIWEYDSKNSTRIASEPKRRRKVPISLPIKQTEVCRFAIKLYHDDKGYFVSPKFGWAIHSHHPYIEATSRHNKKQKICGDDQISLIIHQDRNSRIQYINDWNNVEFSLDLPGVRACDTKVEIHNGVLQVEAERKRSNNRTTSFQRSFTITDIADEESDNLHASLEDGVLRIIIPKKVPVAEAKEDETSTFIPVEVGYPTSMSTKLRSFDLPGVSLSNVTLEIENDTVSVQATRKLFDRESTTKRSFTIDTEKVDAMTLKGYLADGVLTVIGSKRVVPRPKQIVVTTGPAAEKIGEDNHGLFYY